MNLKSKMKLLFKSLFVQFGAVDVNEGFRMIWNEDGELAEGYEVFVEAENENGELVYNPVADGEYHVDNKTIVVAEGKVSEIRSAEPAEPAPEELEVTEPAEPAPEEPVEPANPEEKEVVVDVEEEIRNIKNEFAEMNRKFEELSRNFEQLKDIVAKVLEAPAEEDAFAAAKEKENEIQKGFIMKAVN